MTETGMTIRRFNVTGFDGPSRACAKRLRPCILLSTRPDVFPGLI
jgi:hypothetical protein